MTQLASSYKVLENDVFISDIFSHYILYRSFKGTNTVPGQLSGYTLNESSVWQAPPCGLLTANGQSNKLASHRVQDLLSPEYSEKGTNKRMAEEEQSMYFFSLIEKCNGRLSNDC